MRYLRLVCSMSFGHVVEFYEDVESGDMYYCMMKGFVPTAPFINWNDKGQYKEYQKTIEIPDEDFYYEKVENNISIKEIYDLLQSSIRDIVTTTILKDE